MPEKDHGLFLCAGDVFFTHTPSRLGRLIRWAESDPDEPNGAWANHMGVVLSSGWTRGTADSFYPKARIVEALWRTRIGILQQKPGTSLRVYRWKGRKLWRDHEARELLHLLAAKYEGNTYGWLRLLGHLGDRIIFGGRKVFSKTFYVRPYGGVCSYLAVYLLSAVGVTFGMDPDAADPDECEDYCRTTPSEWEFVGEEAF